MKKMILIFSGALLIGILGGGGGALVVSLMLPPPVYQTGAEAEAETEADTEENAAAEEVKEEVEQERRDAIYFEMHPSFVVNIGSAAHAKFVQIDVVVMGYEKDNIEAFERHVPAVRNDLLLLFSSQEADSLMSPEGKGELRAKSLEVIRAVMTKQYGKPAIEDIFFTKFVVQ